MLLFYELSVYPKHFWLDQKKEAKRCLFAMRLKIKLYSFVVNSPLLGEMSIDRGVHLVFSSSSRKGSYFLLTKSKQKSTAAEISIKNQIILLKPEIRPFSLDHDSFEIESNVPQTYPFF